MVWLSDSTRLSQETWGPLSPHVVFFFQEKKKHVRGAQTAFKMKSAEVTTFQCLCLRESLRCTGCGKVPQLVHPKAAPLAPHLEQLSSSAQPEDGLQGL